MLGKTRLPFSVSRRLLSRFRKQDDGAAAVEFALVSLPFIAMILAVIELGIFFFAARFLEDGVFNAGRKVLTQRLPTGTICSAFKTEVENNLSVWFDKTKLVISVTPLASFSGAGAALNLSGGGCSFGGAGQVLVITASYPYPFAGFRFIQGTTALGQNMSVSASTAFRVEPGT